MDIKDQFSHLPNPLNLLKIPRSKIIQTKRKELPGQVPGTFVISDTALKSKLLLIM